MASMPRLLDQLPLLRSLPERLAQVTPPWLRHRVVRAAMRARLALKEGVDRWEAVVDEFILMVGLGRPREWREAVCAALAGDWLDRLWDGRLSPEESMECLRREAQELHLHDQPLWARKTQHARILLLDTPLGSDGFTVADLQADAASPDPADVALRKDFSEPVVRVLKALSVPEQKVALAYAHTNCETWAEAARLAGFSETEAQAFGRRVQRKLNRQGKEYDFRTANAALTQARRSAATGQ
ncbi:hypothetical protein [Streptomyces sp. NPDC055056]